MARSRDAVIECSLHINGWMTREELGWLYDQAAALPPCSRWLEVGVYCGRSFFTVASAVHEMTDVIGVDDFRGVQGSPLAPAALRSQFLNVALSLPNRNWSLLQMQSTQAACLLQEEFFDVIFIDGSHDYASVWNDVFSWTPVLKNGGLLCGHDVGARQVVQVLKELCPKWKTEVDTIWSWKK